MAQRMDRMKDRKHCGRQREINKKPEIKKMYPLGTTFLILPLNNDKYCVEVDKRNWSFVMDRCGKKVMMTRGHPHTYPDGMITMPQYTMQNLMGRTK